MSEEKKAPKAVEDKKRKPVRAPQVDPTTHKTKTNRK